MEFLGLARKYHDARLHSLTIRHIVPSRTQQGQSDVSRSDHEVSSGSTTDSELAVVATRVAQLRSPGYLGNPGKPYSRNYRIPSWYSVQPRYMIRLHKLRLLTLRLGAAPAHRSISWGNPHLASTCGMCLLHQKPVNFSLEWTVARL